MLRVLQLEKGAGTLAGARNFARRAARPAALAGMMFLLMRAQVLMGLSPLAAALLAAGLAAGDSAAALVAGCLLGAIRLPLRNVALLPLLCCAAVLAGEMLCMLIPRVKRGAPETRVSLVAGLGVLLPALIWAGGGALDSVRALACAALAATAAPLLLPALQIRRGRRRLMLQERAGALLLAGACLAGMERLLPAAAECAATLGILLLPGLGAAAGVLGGLALAAGGAPPLAMAGLALEAMLAHWRGFANRWQRALAVCASALVFRLVAGAGAPEPQWALAAALIYLLLPEAALQRIQRVAAPPRDEACEPDRIAREVTAQARRQLRALGDAFGDMAEGCAAPTDVPGEQELICEMRERLCGGCSGYEDCWNGADNHAVRFLCQLITEALDRVDAPPGMRVLFSDGEIPPDVLRICRRGRMIPDRLGLLLRDFAEKRRSEIKRCATDRLLSVQLAQAREILYDLADRQAAPVSFRGRRLEQLSAALDSAGLTDCDAAAVGLDGAEVRLSREGAPWSREEVRRASRALGRAFGGGFAPELQGDTLLFAQRPRFALETGVSCQSGVAGQVSGDSHMVRALGRGKLMLMISDGMGSGEAAQEESAETLRLLWRFLYAGISFPLALETVNQQMLMRSGEEMFATVDLCAVDLNTGVAEFSKLAASRSLILRGAELLHVEGGRLPLGILERVQPAVTRVRLKPGDVIVMGSDGVMEAGDGMVIDRLARLSASCAPEVLAEHLVREAGLRRGRGRCDDLTCICARMADARARGARDEGMAEEG